MTLPVHLLLHAHTFYRHFALSGVSCKPIIGTLLSQIIDGSVLLLNPVLQ